MQQLGIYEQLITQLIESRIDRERFYVAERELSGSEASNACNGCASKSALISF